MGSTQGARLPGIGLLALVLKIYALGYLIRMSGFSSRWMCKNLLGELLTLQIFQGPTHTLKLETFIS